MPSRVGKVGLAAPRGRRLIALGLALGLSGCGTGGCERSSAKSETLPSAPSNVAPAPSASSAGSSAQAVASAPARYGTSALAHLPKGCAAAARMEWKALANHPLLAGLLHKALHPEPQTVVTNEQKSFFSFLERSNLDLQRDVEQVALCFDRAAEPLAIIAGSLPKDLIPLLQELAPKSERYKLTSKDGVAALTRAGRSLAQGDDRALVMGPNLDQVLHARKLGSNYLDYALPETGEVAVVAQGELIKGAFAVLLPQPFGGLAQRTERLQATFTLATQELVLTATLPSPEEAEVLKTSLSELVRSQAEQWKSKPPSAKSLGFEQALASALQQARWEVRDKELSVRVNVPVGALALMFASK